MADKEGRLETASTEEEETALAWAREAERRNQEMDESGDEGIPAEEVFRRLRSRTKQEAEHEDPD